MPVILLLMKIFKGNPFPKRVYFDNTQKKCEEYWPAQGKQRKYGVIYVANVSTQARADYVIRTFTIKMEGVRQPHSC